MIKEPLKAFKTVGRAPWLESIAATADGVLYLGNKYFELSANQQYYVQLHELGHHLGLESEFEADKFALIEYNKTDKDIESALEIFLLNQFCATGLQCFAEQNLKKVMPFLKSSNQIKTMELLNGMKIYPILPESKTSELKHFLPLLFLGQRYFLPTKRQKQRDQERFERRQARKDLKAQAKAEAIRTGNFQSTGDKALTTLESVANAASSFFGGQQPMQMQPDSNVAETEKKDYTVWIVVAVVFLFIILFLLFRNGGKA